MATGYQSNFGPQAADPLGSILHWAFPHNPFAHPGAQAGAIGHEFLQMFDPTTKSGIANILSMFAGGKFDASPKMGELGMPGQFEPYSVGKAAVGGHMGHDLAPEAYTEAVRSGNKQHAHDLLFGGTVHAKGGIPNRPGFVAPPKDTAEAIAQKLGISPAKVRAQMAAAEKASKNEAHQRAIAQILRNHGFSPNHPALAKALSEHVANAHEGTPEVRVGQSHGPMHKYPEQLRSTIFKNRTNGMGDPQLARIVRQRELRQMLSGRHRSNN